MYTPTKFWEQPIQVAPADLASFTQRLINEMAEGKRLTKKGRKYSASTITSYRNMLDYLYQFQKVHGRNFLLTEINYTFAEEFELFITSQGLALNSVGAIMAKLKAVLKVAWQKGLALWNGTGFSVKTERTTQTYLTTKELIQLRNAKLTQSQTIVLDIFIIQCFTGFRHETLSRFLSNPLAYIKEFNGRSYIDVTSDKSDEVSVVPLSVIVVEILKKYNGNIKVFSKRYINKTIKVVAEKAQLDHNVVMRKTSGGKQTETLKPKCLTVSSHTARRTLLSLLRSQNFSNAEIRAISGHTTEKQMLSYDRSSDVEKIKNILHHSFFNKNIFTDYQ